MTQSNILIVEDNTGLREMLATLLEEEGYAIQTAEDGLAALALMETTRPDLIVSDIMMPRMDGYALFQAVRARPNWTTIPFIFLSAKAERSEVLQGKELGAEDYVTKPFEIAELVAIVRARLTRARALQQAAEADFARLKEQIIRVLSHELRTPLTPIVGFTELLKDNAADLPTEAFQESLEAIYRGALKLWQVTEDMLLLVRIDTGQAAQEFARHVGPCRDLSAPITATVNKFTASANERGVTLTVQVAPVAATVNLYDDFFCDALGRLLDNAIRFSAPHQGQGVTVRLGPAQGGVEVAVCDRGIGIAAEALPRLFARFGQIDRGKLEQAGTGNGLAIAQALIYLHGGEIRAASTAGQGSTFTIWLPAAQQ
jgi:signal transduction histidine kinase